MWQVVGMAIERLWSVSSGILTYFSENHTNNNNNQQAWGLNGYSLIVVPQCHQAERLVIVTSSSVTN